jgi:hypothetical protein
MSIFICGAFQLKEPADTSNLKRLGWIVTEAARAERLHFYLFSGIPQPIVFEILRFEWNGAPSHRIPFLITDSPVWNVSDELVETRAAAMTTLAKVARTLQSLRSRMVAVDLYLSEGYDDNYEIVDATLDDFEAIVLARLDQEPEFEIPSICVRLRWT